MIIECPVPKNQRPLTEYNELKNSFEFTWTTNRFNLFLNKLCTFLFYTVSTITFLVLSSSKWQTHILESFLWIVFISVSLFNIWILRLYLAWLYIYNRLMNASITYEESGWYDGQTWIKSNEMLMQDRLIGLYEVLPILKQLKLIGCLFIFIIFSTLYLNFLLSL